MCLFIHVREVYSRLICISGYRLSVQHQVARSKIIHHNSSPHHNQSRQSSDAAKCNKDEICFHRDTTRGFGSISARNTLRAQAPTEGTENTYRDFTRSNKTSQEALMQSEPCTCRIQNCPSWSSGQDTCNRNWCRNWCTTVDCGAGMSVTGNWCWTLRGSQLVLITERRTKFSSVLKCLRNLLLDFGRVYSSFPILHTSLFFVSLSLIRPLISLL